MKVTVTNGESGDLEAVVKGENVPDPGIPESFKVLVKELQSIGLDIKVLNEDEEEVSLRDDAVPTRPPAATITNTPVKPDSNPPASGTSSYTGNTGSSHVKAMPKTGDNTNIAKWIAVICVSGCVVLLAAVFVRRKKKTDK